jgi:hypothetical protein
MWLYFYCPNGRISLYSLRHLSKRAITERLHQHFMNKLRVVGSWWSQSGFVFNNSMQGQESARTMPMVSRKYPEDVI